MSNLAIRIALAGLIAGAAMGCVPKGKYVEAVNALEAAETTNQGLSANLAGAEARGENLEDYAAELESDVETMRRALKQLRARQALADKRMEQYRQLTESFADMIDSDLLQVKIVDDRMVVELANDILFPSGSAALHKEGSASLARVAEVLARLDKRTFQIEGHTDDEAISTQAFPSNWELASARAITVVKTLEKAGMKPAQMSAASFSFYKPVAANDTDAGKAQNRRTEIVLVPDLSTLPGAAQLREMAAK